MEVFQANCIRLLGGDYPFKLSNAVKQTIKSYYHINQPITIHDKNGNRFDIEKVIDELYLFNSLCVSYNKHIKNKSFVTKNEMSLIMLEVVNRVVKYPKFYYTLINYNLPDKVLIKDNILSELLIIFDLSIDEIKKDDLIYYELSNWKLRGYKSLTYIFKYVNYLHLIVNDNKQQIQDSLTN